MTYTSSHKPIDHTDSDTPMPTPPIVLKNPDEKPYSVIREFGPMVMVIIGVIVGIYLLLGLVVNLVVPHLPVGLEKSLGNLVQSQFPYPEIPDKSAQLQRLLDKFAPSLTADDRRLTYRVQVVQEDMVNAVAIPGGSIIVFSGLLDKVATADEIAFVLAHELGHFHYRHHLKGIGRSLLTMIISIAILGENSSISHMLVASFHQMEMKYSRSQEKEADLYALNLLKTCYGSAEGALRFMEKLARQDKTWQVLYYFASHPHPQDRLDYMKEKLNEQ